MVKVIIINFSGSRNESSIILYINAKSKATYILFYVVLPITNIRINDICV